MELESVLQYVMESNRRPPNAVSGIGAELPLPLVAGGALIYLLNVNVPTHIGPSSGMNWPVRILVIV